MKRKLLTILISIAVLSLCGCNPPDKEEETTTASAATTTASTTVTTEASESVEASETTTGRVGGFIVYDDAPGADIEWEEIGTE